MPLIRAAFILGITLGIHQTASAACTLASQKMIVPPETVTVKRAVQSGAVIQSRTILVPNVQGTECTNSLPFTAQVMGDRSVATLPGILRSNVSGIGLKVSLETSTGRTIQWPSAFRATPDEFKNSKINIELIKLDSSLPAASSSGSLNLQIKSETQSQPVVDIVLPAKYITLLSRSCKVQGNRTINVELPDVPLKHFKRHGSTTARKPFSIDLLCKNDFSTPARVILRWSTLYSGQDRNIGVLPNILPNGAKGIGIQVLDQQQNPINFNQQSTFPLTHQDKGKYTIPFHAQYDKTVKNVSLGRLRAVLYFNAEYE